MLLGSSPESPYDLRFRLFDVPVRVHPMFWLGMFLIGGHYNSLLASAVFIGAAFLSITVHEFGHGLMGRLLGYEPEGIVLYAMGGYCQFREPRQSPWRSLAILFAGPGAGFLLAFLVFLYINKVSSLSETFAGSEAYYMALNDLLIINIVWGILNLLPIWPLDGGRIAGVFLSMLSPLSGQRWGHVISLLVAGAIAAFGASRNDFYLALMFGYLGFMNYQVLQSYYDSYTRSS